MPSRRLVWNRGLMGASAFSGHFGLQSPAPLPGGDEDYPNQPEGFNAITESGGNTLPLNTLPIGAGHENQILGRWWRSNDAETTANFSVATVGDAPFSPTSVFDMLFPNGMVDSIAPGDFLGWETPGGGYWPEIYGSVWIRTVGPNYENQATGTKIWYIPYGNIARSNHSFLMIAGNGSNQAIESSFPMQWYCTEMNADGSDPGFALGNEQNVDPTEYFTAGVWHQVEWYMKRNTIIKSVSGVPIADGILRVWIDGHLIIQRTNMKYCSYDNPRGFYQFRADMVWGGNTDDVRTRDDHIQFDHIYVSGKDRNNEGFTYPNKPSGMTSLVEHSFDVEPGSTGAGIIVGTWWKDDPSNRLSISDNPIFGKDADILFPAGMPDSEGPAQFGTSWPQQSELYVSYIMKIGGSDFEQQFTGTKILGYLQYGNHERNNHFFFVMVPGGGELGAPGTGDGTITAGPFTLTADFTVEFGGPDLSPNENTVPKLITCGEEHHVEVYFKLNDVGVANGIFRVWIDNVRIHNWTNVTMIGGGTAPGDIEGFYSMNFDPVWGGNASETRGRNDHLYIRHIYVAGILMNQHPNEPAGYTPITEILFSGIPDVSGESGTANVPLGEWWAFGPGTITLVDDNLAPISGTKCLQLEYPTGTLVGEGTGKWGGWDEADSEYSEFYEAGWFKMPGTDFESPGTPGWKALGFWGVGRRGVGVPNHMYQVCLGNGSSTALLTEFECVMKGQNHSPWSRDQNVDTSYRIPVGEWVRYELRCVLNDVGVSNGILEMWFDGVKVMNHTDIPFRTPGDEHGFYARHWDPTWGGTGGAAKSRDDFLLVDHVYISGVPL